ncbi:Thioredoxin [Flavobacterium resistens]|uniref:Thioredoxin n=1 Tax=Flavobacterium resistens TaxID=443612 RepID=A0A521D9A4_9FLAO|nr:thioredoxin domain-containing protein [Flavobacterium resistens]MRX70413.1 thioredoxin domain-containing protein [Flavobacterium resistens]SMO68279.1 Thioredoxin [Flavobacterium resistens]
MQENFNNLFQYLEREQINIDKDEFQFQIQSHPDYPTLVSIIDTLDFFNIDNGAFNVDKSEIGLLPDCFWAMLDIKNSRPQFHFVEKKGDGYLLNKGKIAISNQELEARWKNTVLLVEKSKTDNLIESNKSKINWILPFLSIGLFFLIVAQFQFTLQTKFFFIFPTLGVLFSIAVLKDLFGAKSELVNSFCNITSSASCESVVGSTKWKIFESINFSDLSIVFFASQFLGMLTFLFMAKIDAYFSIQKGLLLCAVPLLFTSIYYQKFVEKKWCPICLVIISIILLELTCILFLYQTSFDLQIYPLIVYGFVFVIVALGWSTLKNLLNQRKELKEFQITGNRFIRNYEIFKNSLLSKNRVNLPNSPVILGNHASNTEITIITSPFCGHCKNAHKILDKILIKNEENLKIKIIFNVDFHLLEEKSKDFFRYLMSIYLENGNDAFLQALNHWFETKNLNDWLKKYEQSFKDDKIDLIYEQQNQWCNNNKSLNFTPVIFINGYQYPKAYKKEDLEFFINEILEDDFFVENQIEEKAIIETV